MKINQLKAGAVLSYAQISVSIVVNLVYMPTMIRMLGQSEYGLYQTVISTISMLSVLGLGFNAGYIRFFSRYKQKKDKESIARLNGLFLILFTIIGIIALVCGLFLTFHLDLFFSNGFTEREYQLAKILMLLQSISLATMFPMSVFQIIITANERFVLLKLLGIIKTVFSPLISSVLLMQGFRSVSLVVVTLLIAFISDVFYAYYVCFKMKEKFIFSNFQPGIMKELVIYTIFIAINLIVDLANQNVDKVLLGRFKGTSVTAIYSVGFTLFQLYQMFSSAIASLFTPKIHGIVVRTKEDKARQRKELTSIFIRVGRIQFLILGLIATGIIFFGKPFILYYYAGREYGDSYIVAILLIISGTIALIENLGIEIQRAQNMHQFRSIIYLIMAIVNVVLSVFLCQRYGAIGSAIGTAISYILANGVIMNVFYHKKCNIDIILFGKNIAKMSYSLVVPILGGIAIVNCIDLSRITGFCFSVILYCMIYISSIWVWGMNREEKELIGHMRFAFRRK